MRVRKVFAALAALTMALALTGLQAPVHAANVAECDEYGPFCTEVFDSIGPAGAYTGHDEPSVMFYSNSAGSGNSNFYRMTLPKDPPTIPTQNGTGGTFNFQLHPAFWFGMVMCDNQSAPNPGGSWVGPQVGCTPDSDTNIYDGSDPMAADYIGKHPGVAFMEMQFYAPGWVKWPPGDSCDPSKWCAALNIDSFSSNQNSNVNNNAACLSTVGIEPVNFAFITRNGVATGPANPVDATLATYTPDPNRDLMMQSGDTITVDMHDTSAGFKVIIHDLTKGTVGSMTASVANGFGAVVYDPTATTCTVSHEAFHPAYATSSEHTRAPWTAHSYNVSFSDEIGHFEYCNAIDGQGGNCTTAGVNEPDGAVDADDNGCFAPPFLPPIQSTRIKVGGCLGTDIDFDGVPYQNTWPGTFANAAQDASVHPTSILFTSPKFNGSQDYNRVAFEADLPRIEVFGAPNNCNRSTGAGCVNPPNGANFYPFYSTGTSGGQCVWQLGGAFIPGTTNLLGGSSAAQFGPLLQLTYPGPSGPIFRYNDFRNVMNSNPCT